MRKLLALAVLTVAATSLVAANVRAEEGSGLEISGNITNIGAWSKTLKNTPTTGTLGILNDYGLRAADTKNSSQFGFYNDQVELDLAKSFGENIRARADIDFSGSRASGTTPTVIEQAYVTANIPAGNGWELLVGRFNSGIGLDPVDRSELSTVSFSNVHRTLLPHNLLGARLGYNFNEATRAEFYVVNNLADKATSGTQVPGLGANVVYSWGEEGNSSWVKLNAAASPETTSNKPWSMLADLSASLAVNEALKVGLEGAYRQDPITGSANDDRHFGGQAKATYAFSDVWDGTLRYSIVHSRQEVASLIGVNAGTSLTTVGYGSGGTSHQISLATGYSIADGARLVIEGNLDMGKSRGTTTTSYVPGVAGMFAYSF
ncbi:MAG: outer membrane beta-barrel protein [Deltaproteobacteria bacterium]|nr:MAG: outer membrane beta-barrel protein [Deltaproteobacteria bacterium]